MNKDYVVFPHAEGALSVFLQDDISRGNTLTQEIRKRGGSGDAFEVLARPTAEEALEDARIHLSAAPEGRQRGIVRPVLHLVPRGPI
jgi:hypothetical protein